MSTCATYEKVRSLWWNPLINQPSIVKPFKYESDISVTKFIDAIENEWSAEVFIQNISLWNADVGDVNARHVTHCEEEKEVEENKKMRKMMCDVLAVNN